VSELAFLNAGHANAVHRYTFLASANNFFSFRLGAVLFLFAQRRPQA
jgi:hypothetical protein